MPQEQPLALVAAWIIPPALPADLVDMLKVVLFSFLISCAALAQAELFVADTEPVVPLLGEMFDGEAPDDSTELDNGCIPAALALAVSAPLNLRTPSSTSKRSARNAASHAIRAPPQHAA